MEMFYKAVRPDGTDFHSGTVDYASICGTGEWLPRLPGGPCCTSLVYHASTSAADTLIGGEWPCRLFLVEGEPVSEEENKRGFETFRVIEELPSWQALGPNGEEVASFIEKVRTWATAWDFDGMHLDEVRGWQRVSKRRWACGVAWVEGRMAAWNAATDAAGEAIVKPDPTEWTGNAARSAAILAAKTAAQALVVKDLIFAGDFNSLYGPWRKISGM